MNEKENRESRMTLPELEGGSLQDHIQVLYAHQKTCEQKGKYMQAEAAKKHLAKMKVQLERQRREQMLSRHDGEKGEVEMAHVEEISEFNSYWDTKMLEYQNEAQKIQEEALQRHQTELEAFREQLDRALGSRPKQSAEMINLRRIEENLAKQEKYVEAHKVQKQLQGLEQSQFQRWNLTREGKLRNLLGQLQTKQSNELCALRQRIEQGFEEQKKLRSGEYEKLIQKYQNFLKELENHQTQEMIKFDKRIKTASTISFSRSASRVLQPIN